MRSIVASPLNILLVAAPIAWVIHALAPASPWVFVTAATSLIPLAGLIGLGTEQLARRSGPGLGGFLNATFGNAAELIIAVVALRDGHVALVKASISGSIVGNLLLVLGAVVLRRRTRTPVAEIQSDRGHQHGGHAVSRGRLAGDAGGVRAHRSTATSPRARRRSTASVSGAR